MTNLAYITTFLLGSAIGSFAGVCVYRIPRQQPVALGFSRCDACGMSLTWLQKLPLLGYFCLGGRSRCCGSRIPRRYPALEALTGALFAVLLWRFGPDIQFLAAALFVALLVAAATVDLYHRIIPDKITLPGMVLGLALSWSMPAKGLAGGLVGLFVCGGFLYFSGWLSARLLKRPEAMGGGDIKLAAMIGTFLGWEGGLLAVTLAAFAGTVVGSAGMLLKGASLSARKVPFGPFLAAGAFTVLLWQGELITWILDISE